ncbi:pantothenate kinase [Wuchereria bancrofti]|uniref:pantothenate kinase n=1 Tax=Wuchereria bancrofti TaxID=6293 RepID=J9B8T5_WUCBA|nr:pantothenate kinase [Wuchereria bancrofti]
MSGGDPTHDTMVTGGVKKEEHENKDGDVKDIRCEVVGRRQRLLSLSVPPMPWFGIDIGGTLVKLVYFEPEDHASFWTIQKLCRIVKHGNQYFSELNDFIESEEEILRRRKIQRYLVTGKAYGGTGVRDDHLRLCNVGINGRVGTIHFIRFPTDRMLDFVNLVKRKGFAEMSSTVCATGGGSLKYAREAADLGLQLHKTDELESLIKGIEFIAATNPDECYYYENPLNDTLCRKVIWRWSHGRCSTSDSVPESDKKDGLQYPYIVCNIGSGVSVLAVRGHNQFKRIGGSSIGGGFFQGICAIMCGCETFEEAIELASRGDNKNVDKLVKDIYGSGYDQMGLPGDVIAASFGKIYNKVDRDKARIEDLARSALVTTTNNIGSIAFNGANTCGIDRIVFVGNFLRVNPIAARLLSNAMNFWSKGTKKALFLIHEGYFGAVGCLDKLVDVTETRRRIRAENQQQEDNSYIKNLKGSELSVE